MAAVVRSPLSRTSQLKEPALVLQSSKEAVQSHGLFSFQSEATDSSGLLSIRVGSSNAIDDLPFQFERIDHIVLAEDNLALR